MKIYLHFFLKISFLSFFLFFSFRFLPWFSDSQENHLNKYKLAIANKDCPTLWSIYQNSKGVLNQVARIRSYELCAGNKDLAFSKDQFPKWLQREASKAWLHRASQSKNHTDFIQASLQISKQTSHYEDRVYYLIKALKLAQKVKHPLEAEIKKNLYAVSPSRDPEKKYSIAGARDYKKRLLFKQSTYVFRKILNSKKASIDDKESCFRNLISIYKKTKRRQKYLSSSAQYGIFLKRNLSTNLRSRNAYFKSQINLARRYWTNNNIKKALRILYVIKKRYPSVAPLDHVYWIRGKIFEGEKFYAKAISEYEQGMRFIKNKRSEMSQNLHWSLFWTLRGLNKFKEALVVIDKIINLSKNFDAEHMFWKAQTLGKMQRNEQAYFIYKKITRKTPFNFYGMVSHYKIAKSLTLRSKERPIRKSGRYSLIDDLIFIDEKPLALHFMKEQLRQYYRHPSRYKKEDTLLLLEHVARTGLYLPFFQLIGGSKPKEKDRLMEQYAYSLFPKTFSKEIESASKRFKVPTEIIYSIIRQESAFNPKARSSSNALGLMQVLPTVARAAAKRNKIPYKGFRDLYKPETNILIGTSHLAHLSKRHGNYLILNAAIYNAGATPVRRWLKNFSTDSSMEFIQNIPYKETRQYVKLVIRNYIFYTLINNPKQDVPFPEWILKLPNQKQSILEN